MRAKPPHRDRDPPQVAVLDALAERAEDGMTVLELRAEVDAPIDDLEAALGALDRDGLIETDEADDRTVIRPRDGVVGPDEPDETSVLDRLRDVFGP